MVGSKTSWFSFKIFSYHFIKIEINKSVHIILLDKALMSIGFGYGTATMLLLPHLFKWHIISYFAFLNSRLF